jgi:pimeloyl-ACP methyl ester carboxylesterase
MSSWSRRLLLQSKTLLLKAGNWP